MRKIYRIKLSELRKLFGNKKINERYFDKYDISDIDSPDLVRMEDELDPKHVDDYLPDEDLDISGIRDYEEDLEDEEMF